jgi:hypothetical protein
MKLLSLIVFVVLLPFSSAYSLCHDNFSDFAGSKLRILTQEYHPERVGSKDRPPQARALNPLELQTYSIGLYEAFKGAPAFFRKQLCVFDYVFIDPDLNPPSARAGRTSPGGWGFWADLDQKGQPQSAIGLSARLWEQQPDFASHETNINAAVRGINRGRYQGQATYTSARLGSTFGTRTAGFDTTLLGILAHETGHILWRDQDVFRQRGCYTSWKRLSHRVADNGRFQGFGIFAARSEPRNRDSVYNIYASGEWASLFGTVSPSEDFIESYKLNVLDLASPRLEVLRVQDAQSGLDVDVMSQFRNPSTQLHMKKECFIRALNELAVPLIPY